MAPRFLPETSEFKLCENSFRFLPTRKARQEGPAGLLSHLQLTLQLAFMMIFIKLTALLAGSAAKLLQCVLRQSVYISWPIPWGTKHLISPRLA